MITLLSRQTHLWPAALRLIFVWALFQSKTSASDTTISHPVGIQNFFVPGGSLAAPTTATFAISLANFPSSQDPYRYSISAISGDTIYFANANWTPGALSSTAAPFAVRLTNGAAEGATIPITSNSANALTSSSTNWTQMGAVPGDMVQLLPVDTLNTFFGSTGTMGGPDPTNADLVGLSADLTVYYYYNTNLQRWVRTTGPTTDRGNIQIPAGSVVSIVRKSVPFTLRVVGLAPDVRYFRFVANSGYTYAHTGFPTAVTLGSFALQNRLPGWVASSQPSEADTLSINTGVWLTFFYNGTNWQRTTGSATNRDAIEIPAGAAIQIFRRGTAPGTAILTRPLPYSL